MTAKNSHLWKKGESGNPRGRPKGSIGKKGRINKALLDATDEIARVVITAAKEGDLQAASLVFGRVLPALAPQVDLVQFDLDPAAPLASQVEQVLKAMSTGQVSVDVAKKIIETISTLGAIRQSEELEQRIAQLEAA